MTMNRYSVIHDKNCRELVLLRGRGCVYKKCRFCDYYSDSSTNDEENYQINKSVLEQVTGQYSDLEVINSGSVFELDDRTLELIKKVCSEKGIKTIHFEAHYLFDKKIPELRQFFSDFNLKMKIGLETFDYDFRENVLKKGIKEHSPEIISKNFDEANFLFGLRGQNVNTMKQDIELGLKYFERICVNIMCQNTSEMQPDNDVIETFVRDIYPVYKDNERVDILINNTDFGVGD